MFHTLDLIAKPETLPTVFEVAESIGWKRETVEITLKVSQNPEKLYSHKDENREAQGEPSNRGLALLRFISHPFAANEYPDRFDDVSLRIGVLDLFQSYREAERPTTPEDGPRGGILQQFGVQECIENLLGFWCTTLPNMIILTCGDDFLASFVSDSLGKIELIFEGNENIQSSRQSWGDVSLRNQLEQECARWRPYDVETRIMWNYEEAEIYRLSNALRDLDARTVTVKDQVA